MQKKPFLIVFGLLLLISFPTSSVLADPAAAELTDKPAVPMAAESTDWVKPMATWSAPKYHPEVGDKIVYVNGRRVRNETEFRRAVRNSPQRIELGIVDHRSHQLYHLRTNLWSPNRQTRLGIYVKTGKRFDGVIVTDFMPNSPGMRCQRLKGELPPVRNDWYDDDDDFDEYNDDDWYDD